MTITPRPSADARELAAHVRSLRQVAAVHTAYKLEENHFAMRLCDTQALDAALLAAQDKGFDNPRVKAFLARLSDEPIERALARPPTEAALSALSMKFPNFSEVVTYLQRRAALCRLPPMGPMVFPPLLLDGPPGVGKTAFSKALAAVFGVPMVVMQMSQSTGPFALGGLDAMFVSGGPGQLVRTVALGSHVDPVIVLDELDKTPASSSHDPLGPLFTLLDREAARSYVDEGLRLPLDLSWVKWIGTTNRVERLPEALRSRCRIFSIAPPTPAQGRGIAQALYADLLRAQPWGRHFDAKLSDAVAEAVAAHTPRTMARALHDALGEAAIAGRRSLLASDFPSLAPRRSAGFL